MPNLRPRPGSRSTCQCRWPRRSGQGFHPRHARLPRRAQRDQAGRDRLAPASCAAQLLTDRETSSGAPACQRDRPSGMPAAEPRRALGRREAGSAQPLSSPLGLHAGQRLAWGRSNSGTALRHRLPERVDWSMRKGSAQFASGTPQMRSYGSDLAFQPPSGLAWSSESETGSLRISEQDPRWPSKFSINS